MSEDLTPAGRARIWLAVGIIAVALVGSLSAGRQNHNWPLHAWAVYDEARFLVPTTPRRAVEARVTTADGEVIRLGRGDLVDEARNRTARRAIVESLEDPEWRPVLVNLARRAVGRPLVAVEVWEVTYEVDAYATPPLDRDAPLTEELLLALTPDELAAGS